MFPTILFFIFAAVLVCAALGVILARNPVHCALLLVLCFFNSAVIWLMLDAEFLGIVLVLVYVGAVMVLFLFVVMMLDIDTTQFRKELAGYWPLTVAVAGFVAFAIVNVIVVKHLGGVSFKTAPPLPAALFQYPSPGNGAVHPLCLSRAAGGSHPAGGEHRGHHSDAAAAYRPQAAGHRAAGRRCGRRTACESSRWPPRKDHDHSHLTCWCCPGSCSPSRLPACFSTARTSSSC